MSPGGAPLAIVVAPKRARLRLHVAVAVPVQDLEVCVAYARRDTGTVAAWPPLHGSTPWSHGPAPHELLPGLERRRDTRWRHERFSRPLPPGGVLELPVEPGPAWISIHGRGTDYAPLTHRTTGPVTIPAGETTLSVALGPTARCRGRIVFGERSPRFDACVAVADDAGRLLAVEATGADAEPADVVTTSSQGHFDLRGIPCGTWELRVGTRDELRRGEARSRRREVFTADAVPDLELRF